MDDNKQLMEIEIVTIREGLKKGKFHFFNPSVIVTLTFLFILSLELNASAQPHDATMRQMLY